MEELVEQINLFIIRCSNRTIRADCGQDSTMFHEATNILIHLYKILKSSESNLTHK